MSASRDNGLLCPQCRRPYRFGAESCVWCGRDLPAEPTAALSPNCPACQAPLEAQANEDFLLYACPQCWGVWLSLPALKGFERLYEKVTPIAPLAAQPAAAPAGHVDGIREFREPQSYRRCPLCRNEMARRRYQRVSNFVVDRCLAHGVWFDPGEFEMAIDFLGKGGLERSRRAEGRFESSMGGYAELLHTIDRFRTMYHVHMML